MTQQLLSFFVWLALRPSEEGVRRLARWGGVLWFHLVPYRRRVMLENLARAFPGQTREERRALCKAACQHLVLALFEFLRVERSAHQGFPDVEFSGVDPQQLLGGRGSLVLTGHLGSFEHCAGALAKRLGPGQVWLVVRDFPPGTQQVVERLRRASGLGLLKAQGSMSEILRRLAEGRCVVFVLDQNSTRSMGVFVDFFGQTACTMAALALLARRSRAPVFPVAMWREDGRHVVKIDPPIPSVVAGKRRECTVATTQCYTKFLEERIRSHPEQWLWTHRRWKTQPKPEVNTDTSSEEAVTP